MAQTPSAGGNAGGDVLGEIVVTAQRRAQNIQDVGTAITAVQGEDIAAMGSNDLSALVSRVPALQFNQFSPLVTIFNIRGVSQNDFADHLEAPIAVYIDDTYLASMAASNGQMFDIERVEVARGPQGTLFGRNATGGLIHVITAKPTDTLDGFFALTGGSFDQLNTEGAIGGPLTESLRGRVSFATNYNEGYVTNRIGPDAGNAKNAALRLQLAADLGSDAEFLLKLHGIRNDDERGAMYAWQPAIPSTYGLGVLVGPNEDPWGTCTGCDAGGYRNPSSDPYNQAYNSPNYFNRRLGGATGTFTVDLPVGTFVSVSDYSHMTKRFAEDSDASPNSVYTYVVNQKFEQYSQELRLSRDAEAYHWTAGLYYLHVRSDDEVTSTFFPGGPTEAYTPFVDVTSSWAAYGQVEYRFSSQWSGILGARYSSDTKEQDYSLYYNGVLDSQFNPTLNPNDAKKTFDGFSAKAEIDFKPSDDVLLYVSYNRGTKGGGFSAPNFGPINPSQLPYEQEVLTAYEAGFKLTLADGRARFNGAGFYYDYEDYQAFSFFGLVPAIKNQDATIQGFELELSAIPLPGLTAQLGMSVLSTEVKDVVLPDRVTVVDRVMPQAPPQSYNALLRYEFDVGEGEVALETDWKHDARQYFTSLNHPDEYAESRTYGNVRASYRFPGGNWQAQLFVNNVTDKPYDIYRFDFSAVGLSQRALAKPRWYGLTVTYRL